MDGNLPFDINDFKRGDDSAKSSSKPTINKKFYK